MNSEKIRLIRDNKNDLEFEGIELGTAYDDIKMWEYTLFETDEKIKSCDYIIYIDRTHTRVHVGSRYSVIELATIEDTLEYINKEIGGQIGNQLLELLGINTAEQLK